LPSLRQIQRDRQLGDVTQADEAGVLESIRDLLPELRDKVHEGRLATGQPRWEARVLACPANDEEDQLSLGRLRVLLDGGSWSVEVVGEEALSAEVADQAEEEGVGLLFIGSASPRGLPHCRYLCKRLRRRFPDRKIVVGRWGSDGEEE